MDLSDLPDELAAAVLDGDALAMVVGEGPNQTPPEWRWVLETMRELMEGDGEAMGMVMAGTSKEAVMVPAPAGPADPLKMLIVMRKTGNLQPINWVLVATDTYTRVSGTGDWPEDGIGATEAFKRGMPDASEALLVACLAPDGPGYDVQQTYTRTPEGIVWDEPKVFDPGSSGVIADLMREVVTA